jgi:hypothetical protein
MNKLADTSSAIMQSSDDRMLNISLDPANLDSTEEESIPFGYETDQVISIDNPPMDDDITIHTDHFPNSLENETPNSLSRGDEEDSSSLGMSSEEIVPRYSTRSSTRANR